MISYRNKMVDQVDNHSQLAASPAVHLTDWDHLNNQINIVLIQLHSDLANGLIEVAEAGDCFSTLVLHILNTCSPTLSYSCGSSSKHRHRQEPLKN